MISLAINEIILFALSLAATIFITMAYTHLPLHEIPIVTVLAGGVLLYCIRLIIHQTIHRQNKLHYKKMRGDDHIKVYLEPKASALWKYIIGVFVLLVIFLISYKYLNPQGLFSFEWLKSSVG